MPFTRAKAASPTPDGAGFRVLLELVLEVLGARPAFAMTAGGRHATAGGGRAAGRPFPAPAGAGHAPAAGRGAAALPDPAPRPREAPVPPPPQPQPRGPRHAVDDTHVEIWQLVTRAQQGDVEA